MEFERTRRRAPELNLIPLVDIVFHILVFVMLTMSFVVSESIELTLPQSATAPAASVNAGVRLELLPSGHVAYNGEWLDGATLSARLKTRIAEDDTTRLTLVATPGVSVQQLVSIMDMVYLAGGRNVSVDRVR